MERFEYQSKPKRLEIETKNPKSAYAKPSIEEAQ